MLRLWVKRVGILLLFLFFLAVLFFMGGYNLWAR